MKIILSSKKLEKLTKQINRHCKNTEEQPITLKINIIDNDLDIEIHSDKGNVLFNLWGIDKIK